MVTISTQSQSPPPGLVNLSQFAQGFGEGSALPPTPFPTDSSATSSTFGPTTIANINPNSIDKLSQLNELIYNTIAFPCIMFKETGSQDIAIHKYPNVDAAEVENTGRNPLILKCRAVLTNSIQPSANESWVAGTLFPTVFNQLYTQLLNDSSGINNLVHPILGTIPVKVVEWDYELIGKGPRDGVFLDITWIETINKTTTLSSTISAPSQLSSMINTGAQLDGLLATPQILNLTPPGLNIHGFMSLLSTQIANFVAFPQQITAPIGATILAAAGFASTPGTSLPQVLSNALSPYFQNKNQLLAVPPNGVTYNAQFSQNLVTTLFNVNGSTNNNPSQLVNSAAAFVQAMINYYQYLNIVETAQLVSSLYTYLQSLQSILASQNANNTKNFTVQQYYVLVPTSLYALSRYLNNSIDDLLTLNSNTLGTSYLVQQNTQINYYQA